MLIAQLPIMRVTTMGTWKCMRERVKFIVGRSTSTPVHSTSTAMGIG